MRFALSAAALAAAVLAVPLAHAQSTFRLEATVGSSKLSDEFSTLSDRATAVGLIGRTTYPSGLGWEVGVRGHGEWVFSDGINTVRPDATSYQVGLTYDLPVGPVTLGARIGAHAWRLRGNVVGAGSTLVGRFEDSGGGLYHALGARYDVSDRLGVGAYYTVYRLGDGLRVQGLDLRLSYAF